MAEIKKYLDNLATQELVKQIKAKDAATLQSAKDYADGLAGNYEAAGSAASALADAKKYTDEQIAEKADAKGSAAAVDTKLTAEVNRATAKENEIVASVEAVDAKADANKASIDAINHADTGILAQAKADATTKANAVQANVDALGEKVGDIPEGATATTVVGYVDEKVAAANSDVTALGERVTQAEADIDAIQADYLKSVDKTALEGKITEEANRAKGAEEGLSNRIKTIEDDYLKAADKTELQGNITANAQTIASVKEDVDAFFADADMTESAKDTLKELQEYIKSDETGAAAMSASIKANTDNITSVKGRMDTAEGKITTLEGEMDAVEGAVATKAEAQALADEVKARTDADTALDERLDAVELKLGEGEGSVTSQIATAKQEAIDAAATDASTKANQALADAKKYADDEDAKIEARVDALETDTHTHANKAVIDGITAEKVTAWDNAGAKVHEHANKSVLDGITSEKVSAWDDAEQNAKDYADTELAKDRARLDSVEAKATANASAVATKAEQADLTAAVERITTAEAGIASNKSAIESFVAVTPAEVIAMFAAAE